MIALLIMPLLWTSCSGPRAAVDDGVWVTTDEPETEYREEVAISAERLALLDSLVYIRANDALNLFLIAQREAAKGNIQEALENTALSLEIYETADAMVFKGALFSALRRDEEAAYWFKKASHMYPFADIDKYSDILMHIKHP